MYTVTPNIYTYMQKKINNNNNSINSFSVILKIVKKKMSEKHL